MNKKIGVILALVLVSFLMIGTVSAGLFDFLGGGSNSNSTNDESTFIVGFDAEFPPYGYQDDNGNYTGFDLELAQEVCKRNNWTFKAQPIDWDAKDAELDSGSIDCIWNGFTIDGRENDYLWSNPYFDNKQIFVVKDPSIKTIADLKDKTVETQKDSSALAALEGGNKTIADSFKALNQVADYNTAFMDLKSGACDAVAMDIGVAQYDINKKNDTQSFSILNESITTEKYGIGFKKGNDALKDQVQKTLDEMFKDGTVAKIAQKYGISEDALIQP
jgi:polar amino acid transport system substrate-binding protein